MYRLIEYGNMNSTASFLQTRQSAPANTRAIGALHAVVTNDRSPTNVIPAKEDDNRFIRYASVVLTGIEGHYRKCRKLVTDSIAKRAVAFRDSFVDGSIEARVANMRRGVD